MKNWGTEQKKFNKEFLLDLMKADVKMNISFFKYKYHLLSG